ncbi:hypothetical protein DV495_004708 [Geotrichum candidum]|nr:hypothetical protein DV495_004708 [Geotrichum candidum]
MVAIELKPRNKTKFRNLPSSIELSDETKVEVLAQQVAKASKLSIHRIRLTVPNPAYDEAAAKAGKRVKRDISLSNDLPLSHYVGTDAKSITVGVKDLGPQLGWRAVYLVEYFGPLIIHPIFYFGQKAIYGETFDHTRVQQLAFIFVMLHFLKREVETAFIHRFSLATMPAFNIFKNSGHYWILSGFNLAYFIYAPPSYTSAESSALTRFLFGGHVVPLGAFQLHVLTALWLFAELSNFWTHLYLASLRADGSKDRKIPRGYGFNLVSFPNYFFETLAWFVFLLVTQNWSSLLFLIVGGGQMAIWAIKKHKRYRKDFGDKYPRNRKAMIPFIF